MENLLEDNMISLYDYAESRGISYEAVRKQINGLKNKDPDFESKYIVKNGRKRFLNEEGIKILNGKRASNPVVVDSAEKSEKIKNLKLENRELREKYEKVMEQLLVLQQKGVDTTKYIAIEDHQKTEKELEESRKKIEDLEEGKKESDEKVEKLTEENGELLKSNAELKDVTIKNSKLVNEIDEKMKQLESTKEENLEMQKQLLSMNEENRKAEEARQKAEEDKRKAEEARQKAEEDKRKAEEEKKKAEDEAMDFLQLGFFARRRKLKELKQKKAEE